MDKAPAFQFYPADWLDVRVLRMSLQAQGAYIRWLCHMWRDSEDQCSIENSVAVLSRLVGVTEGECAAILREIQWPNDPIFIESDGRLVSKRLQRIKKEQVARSSARSQAGRNGNRLRWSCDKFAIAKDRSSSSSSSSSAKEEKSTGADAPPVREVSRRLVTVWNEGRPVQEHIRITSKRLAKVAGRLRDGFTEEQLTSVVRKNLHSRFHQGENDRGWKAPGPEWVLNSTERVEEWLGKNADGKGTPPPKKEIKCRNCGDSGVMAGGTPCNSCRRKEIGRVANA